MLNNLKLHSSNSKERIDFLIKTSLLEEKEDREVDNRKLDIRDRVCHSLSNSNDIYSHQLSFNIRHCKKYTNQKKDKVCQSLWCGECRNYLSENYKNRITKRLSSEHYTNKDLHHISGVIGLCEVDDEKLSELLNKDNLKWRRIRDRLQKKIKSSFNPFIEVVYEFELVNWTFLRKSEENEYKKKQIRQLIQHQRFNEKVFLYVHFHSITNLKEEEINKVFKNEYFIGENPLIKTNKDNGLYIQKFNQNKSLIDNLTKLTSYPFKNPIRYKHSFIGSDYLNGEYFDVYELSKLVSTYQKIQKRSWRGLFRTIETT